MFPWLLCTVFGCMIQQGKTMQEWRLPHPPKGAYVVFLNRPCVPVENVQTVIRYEDKEVLNERH